jgi:hypothetical protein
MADDVDRAQDYIELRLNDHIERARAIKPKFDWVGSCYCGEVEGDNSPHFCGVWCRDQYEKERRARAIKGSDPE